MSLWYSRNHHPFSSTSLSLRSSNVIYSSDSFACSLTWVAVLTVRLGGSPCSSMPLWPFSFSGQHVLLLMMSVNYHQNFIPLSHPFLISKLMFCCVYVENCPKCISVVTRLWTFLSSLGTARCLFRWINLIQQQQQQPVYVGCFIWWMDGWMGGWMDSGSVCEWVCEQVSDYFA